MPLSIMAAPVSKLMASGNLHTHLAGRTRRSQYAPGGWLAIRDIVMAPDRVAPVSGALFAVNMLVATRGGGTYTFAEIRDDLRAAGFTAARLLRRDPAMNCVVAARKPA